MLDIISIFFVRETHRMAVIWQSLISLLLHDSVYLHVEFSGGKAVDVHAIAMEGEFYP